MSLNNWFEKGVSTEKYIESLEDHKDGFLHINNHFTLPEDPAFYQLLQDKNLRVIVLAEPWCGHCMLNIPILLHLTEKTKTPIRFLHRDVNVELMDQYLTNGNRVIPIFIFIDQDGYEVAKWGPIAKETKEFVDQYKAELPEKDAENYKEEFTKLIKFTSKEFKENKDIWNFSYTSMKDALQDSLT